MDTKDPKSIALAVVAALVLVIAVVLIWQQVRAMQPNAIYEGAHGPFKSGSSVADKLHNIKPRR